jgi:hypothetical protein
MPDAGASRKRQIALAGPFVMPPLGVPFLGESRAAADLFSMGSRRASRSPGCFRSKPRIVSRDQHSTTPFPGHSFPRGFALTFRNVTALIDCARDSNPSARLPRLCVRPYETHAVDFICAPCQCISIPGNKGFCNFSGDDSIACCRRTHRCRDLKQATPHVARH